MRVRIHVTAALILLVSACRGGYAPPAIDVAALSTEEGARAVQLISDRIALSGRLRAIEYAIVTRAAAFCRGVERPHLGVVLASESSFTGKVAKTAARENVGLGERVSIVYVVPGAPLHTAGIRAGDVIVSADGRDIATQEDLFTALGTQVHPVSLRLERGGQAIEHIVEPEPACPVSLEYAQSAELLPAPTSRTTAGIPRGLIRLFPSDDDLAIVIGHQLAHLIFDRPTDDEITRERRADELGLYLTARADFDVSRAVGVWEDLVSEYPWLSSPRNADAYRGYPHQGVAMRMEGIRKTLEKIAELRASGATLIPPR
jgi:beta-barrel assembly-enhancing protease